MYKNYFFEDHWDLNGRSISNELEHSSKATKKRQVQLSYAGSDLVLTRVEEAAERIA